MGQTLVNSPSFVVRTESEKHIEFASTSPLGGGRPGRVKRKTLKNKKEKDAAGAGGDKPAEEDL